MPSAKPPKRPAFDATAFSARLYERVTSAAGGAYTVFKPKDDAGTLINFPRWNNWISTLRNVVNANAIYLDEVKLDLDTHIAVDNERHQKLANRVSALENASSPFPG